MKKTQLLTGLFLSGLMAVTSVQAAPAPADKDRHTPQGLYATAQETYDMMQEDDSIILVDVRTPEEWQFVGYTPMADIMIPSVTFDYSKDRAEDFNEEKGRYAATLNENFVSEFENKLFDLDADQSTTFVIMCRSGATRAQPAAKALWQYGYKNVYIMTDGFEGGKLKEGDRKGYRLKAGWKVNGLPWTYKIDKNKAFFK